MKVPCIIPDPEDRLAVVVDEVDAREDPLAEYYIRALPRPPWSDVLESRMPMDRMKLRVIGQRIDKSRVCYTKVYISENCLLAIPNEKHREKSLKRMVDRLLPWLFTYGERAIQKLP